MLTYNGGEVKAELYRRPLSARRKSKGVLPVSSSSQNSGVASYASAETQFRCGGPVSS